MKGRALRIATGLTGLAGLAGFILLIAYHNVAELTDLLLGAGWGIALVTIVHILPMAAAALGWYEIARPLSPPRFAVFLWARLVRESADALLPLTQIGGDVIAARLLTIHGARAVNASATALVDLTLEFVTQIAFTAVGILLLVMLNGGGEPVRWALLGLVIAVLAAAGFLLAQRWGMFSLLELFLERLAKQLGWPALGALSGLHETVISIYRRRRVLGGSVFWHLVSWLLGTVEMWLALRFLGIDIGIGGALVIESLGQAIRSAAFLVPGALGVQEGGFLILAVHFGLAPEVGLSLSLIRRIREAALGIPALLAWQVIEGCRLFDATDRAGDEQR
jgi:putative membrane protein